MAPGAEEIDLGGRLTTPGLIDAHNHYLQTAENLQWVDLRFPGIASTGDLMAAMGAAAATTPHGQWVRGFGLDHAKFGGDPPTRWDLDRAAADHPMLIQHVSGHYAVVNSAAMAARGIGDDVADPKGGRFLRDESGRPNGWLLDAATSLVLPVAVDVGNHAPNIHTDIPPEELLDALDKAGPVYFSVGLTTVVDAQVTRRELAIYREAKRRGTLHCRTVCMPLSHQIAELHDIGLAGPFGDDALSIGPMKLYSDGALTGGTACFSRPYGPSDEYSGQLFHEPEELADLVERAHVDGWQVGIHTQGDRAISMCLDAIERAMRRFPREDARHRLEHAGYPAHELERIARLGVVTINQPGYLFDFGEFFLDGLGDRAQGLQPLRAEKELGILVALSSDAMVTTYDPLHCIAVAVDRRTRGGAPIGADQALSVEEAIRGYTIDAARAMFLEDRLGSIEAGKLGDLVVWDRDLFSLSGDELEQARVWMTVLGGEAVYRATA
jgi:predicted amidohydrolase YtcJ